MIKINNAEVDLVNNHIFNNKDFSIIFNNELKNIEAGKYVVDLKIKKVMYDE